PKSGAPCGLQAKPPRSRKPVSTIVKANASCEPVTSSTGYSPIQPGSSSGPPRDTSAANRSRSPRDNSKRIHNGAPAYTSTQTSAAIRGRPRQSAQPRRGIVRRTTAQQSTDAQPIPSTPQPKPASTSHGQ